VATEVAKAVGGFDGGAGFELQGGVLRERLVGGLELDAPYEGG
jgi:hypothetical protein